MPSLGKQGKSMGIWVEIWKFKQKKSILSRMQGTGSDMAMSLMCSNDRKKATVTRAKRIRCGMKGEEAARSWQGLNHIGP